MEEKQRNTLSSRLRAVPPMLPALMRGVKIAKKAGLADGEGAEKALGQMQAAINSLRLEENGQAEAVGKLLMQLSVYCAKHEIDAEKALGDAIETEIQRVEHRENTQK